jgi:hypothetical protein
MIQIHSRPRVLLLGSTCGDPSLDAALRDIADVYTLPGAEYEDEAILIQEAVKTHGPFDIFGVSPPLFTSYKTDKRDYSYLETNSL